MRILPYRIVLCSILFAIPNASYAAPLTPANYRIQLTDLGTGVTPNAINNVGQVAGQGGNGQAFFWSNGILTPIAGVQSAANDLNDNGIVVGWSIDAKVYQRAFMWSQPVGFTNIDISVGSGITGGSAEAINSSGEIVGWRANGTVFRSTIWDQGSPNGTLVFGTGNHKALSVNNNGEVVGITLDFINDDPEGGYYWNGIDSSSYTSGLGQSYFPFGGISNIATTGGQEANFGAELAIGDVNSGNIGRVSPSDTFSVVNGLNDIGFYVGESSAKGFVYDISTGSLLNINDFTQFGFNTDSILRLTDINNTNQFVGVATVGGIEHGFIGEFVAIPEPSSYLLILCGLFLVCRVLCQHRVCCKNI